MRGVRRGLILTLGGALACTSTVEPPSDAGPASGRGVTARAFTFPASLDADFSLADRPRPDLAAREADCRREVDATSGADVTEALRAAVTEAAGGCVVLLPAGEFVLTRTVELSDGVVIRGAGAGRTTLLARLAGASPAFRARGRAEIASETSEVVRGDKGDRWLTVSATLAAAAAAAVAQGSLHLEVAVDNDPERLPEEWARPYAAFAIGQLARVTAVEGTRLSLDRPLNETYATPGLVRRLELLGPEHLVEDVGLADLTLVREDDHHAGTVAFERTVGAFLLRVHLERTGWAHLHVDRSLACQVRQSFFFDAHGFGGGGQGYGVNLRHHTTGCLVEDNVFDRLRHAIILQLGANGNVVAYNHATRARDDFGLVKADISLHGHYTHMNLIEGNAVEYIHVSDWWGPAPFHTLFRNRVWRGGITIDDRSHGSAAYDNVSAAAFIGREAFVVADSVRNVDCIHNLGPDGAPLEAGPDCDDENDPARRPVGARPASLYRATSLVEADGRIPAERRAADGAPIPGAE